MNRRACGLTCAVEDVRAFLPEYSTGAENSSRHGESMLRYQSRTVIDQERTKIRRLRCLESEKLGITVQPTDGEPQFPTLCFDRD